MIGKCKKISGKTLLSFDIRTDYGAENIIYTLVLVRRNDMAIDHRHFILSSNYLSILYLELRNIFPESYYDLYKTLLANTDRYKKYEI